MTLKYNAMLRSAQGAANFRLPDFPARSLGIGPGVRSEPVPGPDPRNAQSSVKVDVLAIVADQLSPSYQGVPGRGSLSPTKADTTGSPWYGPEVGF